LFDNLQLTADTLVDGEDDDDDENDKNDKNDKVKKLEQNQSHSNTNEEILSQKMEQNTIQEKIQERTDSAKNSQNESAKIITCQQPHNALNDKDENQDIPITSEKMSQDNKPEHIEKMNDENENDNNDDAIYTKEELELSLFEMLEVTRINLEGQLQLSQDNITLILKLIDTRK